MSLSGVSRPRLSHRPQNSLGSLYETLADLDDDQLDYLVQEINHTGHQNVPVSKAVTAFETDNPTSSLRDVRKSMPPPPFGVTRQLSKSERGQLRLHTAFQRAPSLRNQRRSPTTESIAENETLSCNDRPKSQALSVGSFGGHDFLGSVLDIPSWNLSDDISLSEVHGGADRPGTAERDDHRNNQTPPPDHRRTSPAYKRVSRPDFNLPYGITIEDLLDLLKTEFLSNSLSSVTSTPSTSFASTASPSPTSGLLSPASSLFSTTSTSAPSPKQSHSTQPQSPCSSFEPKGIRRRASRLEMALEAERSTSGFEGMSMLEPRPLTPASMGTPTSARGSPTTPVDPLGRLRGETPPMQATQALVMEGIFDVLENR